MTDSSATVGRRSRWTVFGAWVCGIASVGGMVAMVLIAVEKVSTGHGFDTYRTKWMVEDNWIGFLVFVVATVLVLLTAGCIGWFQRCMERLELLHLQEKHVEKHRG